MLKTVTIRWRHVSPGLQYAGQHLQFSLVADSVESAYCSKELIQKAWTAAEPMLELHQDVEKIADEVAENITHANGLLSVTIAADHDAEFTYVI